MKIPGWQIKCRPEVRRLAIVVVENNEKSAYATLGLHKGATPDEIKLAYVTLVKKYDPEKHTDRFMIIDKAFTKLKEPASRAREDVRTFNFVKGEFLFSPEERKDISEVQISQAIDQIERKRTAGEIPPAEADQKLIQGYMMRSYRNVQKRLWNEAITDWQRMLNIDPTHARAKNNLLYSFITLGYSYANHNLFDEALEVWRKAAQMNPDDPQLIHNLALACEFGGHADEASRYWQEAIKRWKAQLERQPDNEYLKNCIIEALRQHSGKMESNDSSSAAETSAGGTPVAAKGPAGAPTRSHGGVKGINEYREILKLNPNDFEAQFKIASFLMNERQWPEAIKELTDLQKKNPRNLEVMNLLGWALLNGGKVDDSFIVWRKANAIDPRNPQIITSLTQAHMSMGRMLRDKGHYTPSLVHFKALQRYQPDNAEVHFEIGKTYQLQGNERSAYQEYNLTIKLDPKHKESRIALSSLKLRR